MRTPQPVINFGSIRTIGNAAANLNTAKDGKTGPDTGLA
jgi:hypothetical protein